MHEVNFHIWNLSSYEGVCLVTRDGRKVAYKLDGGWQLRAYNSDGFYLGELIGRYDAAVSFAAYLNHIGVGIEAWR